MRRLPWTTTAIGKKPMAPSMEMENKELPTLTNQKKKKKHLRKKRKQQRKSQRPTYAQLAEYYQLTADSLVYPPPADETMAYLRNEGSEQIFDLEDAECEAEFQSKLLAQMEADSCDTSTGCEVAIQSTEIQITCPTPDLMPELEEDVASIVPIVRVTCPTPDSMPELEEDVAFIVPTVRVTCPTPDSLPELEEDVASFYPAVESTPVK